MLTALRSSLIVLLALWTTATAVAQPTQLSIGPDSKLWIDGTSNKSDWTVTASELAGTLTLDADGMPSAATVQVDATKIESNKSKIMDRLMYRALKTQEHPTITYTLMSASGPQADTLSAQGEVRVAGVTRAATLHVEWMSEDGGRVRIRGSHPMKMSDHGMKPPTAMFGALHTADDVVVSFDVVFVPSEMATGS